MVKVCILIHVLKLATEKNIKKHIGHAWMGTTVRQAVGLKESLLDLPATNIVHYTRATYIHVSWVHLQNLVSALVNFTGETKTFRDCLLFVICYVYFNKCKLYTVMVLCFMFLSYCDTLKSNIRDFVTSCCRYDIETQ